MDKLYTVQEVAGLLGVSPQTIYNWRTQRRGPRATRVGGFLRYRSADIEAWLKSHRDPAA